MNLFEKYVNLYIAVSLSTKEMILEKTRYREKKINIIYNFVDLNKFFPLSEYKKMDYRKKY
jgi:hypothetical protein